MGSELTSESSISNSSMILTTRYDLRPGDQEIQIPRRGYHVVVQFSFASHQRVLLRQRAPLMTTRMGLSLVTASTWQYHVNMKMGCGGLGTYFEAEVAGFLALRFAPTVVAFSVSSMSVAGSVSPPGSGDTCAWSLCTMRLSERL